MKNFFLAYSIMKIKIVLCNSEESDDNDDEYLDACNLCGIILYSYEELDDHQSNYLRCENCSVCFHNEFQWNRHDNCDNCKL